LPNSAGRRGAARATGVVAAYVWDYAEGMQLMRRFWDAAIALDPKVAELDESPAFRSVIPNRSNSFSKRQDFTM